MDTESYFKGRTHQLPMLSAGEILSPAHFVNDPNRRAPPPMQRDNAGDPSRPQPWTPPTVAYALQKSTADAASQLTGANRHSANLLGASGSSTDRLVSKGMDASAVHAPPIDGVSSSSEMQGDDMAAVEWTPASTIPPSAAASVPFGAGRHQVDPFGGAGGMSRHEEAAFSHRGDKTTQGAAGVDFLYFKTEDQPDAFYPDSWPKAKRPSVPDNFSDHARHAAPPIDKSPTQEIPAAMALKVALQASCRSIDAMIKARDLLEAQIKEETRNRAILETAIARAEQG